jgi:hypothetical protein
MKHALLLGNLFQLAIVTLLVVYATREQGRRVLIMLGLAVVLTAVMSLAGCAHSVQQSRVAPGCVVTAPPPIPLDAREGTDEEVKALGDWAHATWLACASMRAEDYPPSPLYEEAGEGEEGD